MNDYTVVLIYPDYIANQYGEDFYIEHATAASPADAVRIVQRTAWDANIGCPDDEEDDARPEDFAVVAVFAGHLEDLTPGD